MSNELSAREAEILHWIALGKTNPEIGSILNISAFTVKNHVQRILKKLDVTNRTQAVGKTQAFQAFPNQANHVNYG
jgi:DNA-binding CsgD family transcriptional regulator